MSPRRYKRVARLTVGREADLRAYDQRLRVTFVVERDSFHDSDRASITIFNLNEASRAALEVGAFVTLAAGYEDQLDGEGNPPQIFVGDIRYVDSDRVGPDRGTHIEADDGGTGYKSAVVALTLTGTVTPLNEWNAIKQSWLDAGIAISSLADPIAGALDPGRSYANGVSHFGLARDAMRHWGEQNGVEWGIQDGVLQLTPQGETFGLEEIVLTPSTGLIGSPKKLRDGGVSFVALIDQRLKPWRRVRPESAEIAGSYRLERVTLRGDTRGQPWFAEAEASELPAAA